MEIKKNAQELKKILWRLEGLTPRERFIFLERYYWETDMRELARELKISLGRCYELLYRAEEKIQKAQKGLDLLP